MALASNSPSSMGELGKGGDVRVKGGDAGIESVEKHKLVEEAHAPLHCLRVLVVPPQYDVHPVYALLPVLMTSLSREGALVSLHQVCTRVVAAVLQPKPPDSAHWSVQLHRECGRTTAVVQEGSQSRPQ